LQNTTTNAHVNTTTALAVEVDSNKETTSNNIVGIFGPRHGNKILAAKGLDATQSHNAVNWTFSDEQEKSCASSFLKQHITPLLCNPDDRNAQRNLN